MDNHADPTTARADLNEKALPRLFDLTGRTALITGAGGALGAHFAAVLGAAGATIIHAARRLPEKREDPNSRWVVMDVSDQGSISAALEKAGPIDILVNNAGIAVTSPFETHTAEDWDMVMDVNLRGAFLVARAYAQERIASGLPGCIINITSILGERVIGGVSSYTASKAALLHLTRSMAIELARHRIRVNALSPGYVATAINRDFFASGPGQAMIKRIPQRRLSTMDDLTGPLLLLASEASAGMTGSVITVDGGHSINAL